MILCPHCRNSVDERQRVSCPVCLAPFASPAHAGGVPAPYAPPPGSITPRNGAAGALAQAYLPQPAPPHAGYAPPPGSPYAIPSGSMPPPPGLPGAAPGYGGPGTGTRTTLTGEVVAAAAPLPGYGPGGGAQGYAAPSGYAPHPAAYATAPPMAQAKKGIGGSGWGIAGGGAFTVLYIVARVLFIGVRMFHPSTGTVGMEPAAMPAFSSGAGQSFTPNTYAPNPNGPSYRMASPQMPIYTPPNFPLRQPFRPSFQPQYGPRFQPPAMPTMPGARSGFPGPMGLRSQ